MGSIDQPESGSNQPESPSTDCLSSNATLFWRVFVPIFGTVFLSGLVLALLLIPGEDLYLPFSAWWGRLVALAAFAGWIYWIKNTIWRLKRVDADASHVYVTNFWHTVRYPWTDVENISESRRAGRRLIHLELKAPGRFGRVVSFLPARHYDELRQQLGF